ncbi:short-chain dehydrogenase/reductase SDR [Anopheles sinensis]|uniref:Short-chain dehydrogenase/reductase SDR n=1 Tax=Anopheles sinensis TaxID=74873 RepID=A0A084VSH2_ANOSI|nr:short-chain dehydrogenase/reductase SDR [Anopheles sinensis]
MFGRCRKTEKLAALEHRRGGGGHHQPISASSHAIGVRPPVHVACSEQMEGSEFLLCNSFHDRPVRRLRMALPELPVGTRYRADVSRGLRKRMKRVAMRNPGPETGPGRVEGHENFSNS